MSKINLFQVVQNDVQYNGLIFNKPDKIEIDDAGLALEIDKGRKEVETRKGVLMKPMSTLLCYFEPLDLTSKGEKMYEDFMADFDRKGNKVEKKEEEKPKKEKAKPGPKKKEPKEDGKKE